MRGRRHFRFAGRGLWTVLVVFAPAGATLAQACGDDSPGTGHRKNPVGDAAPGGATGDAAVPAETGGASASGGASGVPRSCKNSLDCGTAQVCDQSTGRCVDCVTNRDCNAGLECTGQRCRPPCTSDKQCTSQGLLCNQSLGVCVDCVADGDCAPGEVCRVGVCETNTPGAGGSSGSAGVAFGGGTSSGGSSPSGGTAGGGGIASGGSPSSGGTPPTGGSNGTGGSGLGCNRVDLWLAVDKSGSMGNAFDTGNEWQVLTGGLDAFVKAALPRRAAAGAVVFPKSNSSAPTSCCTDTDCGSFGPCVLLVPGGCTLYPGICSGSGGCNLTDYDGVDVPMTALPDAGNLFSTFLSSVTPQGGSYLAPALDRMRQRAASWATANSSDRTAIVLVTDGAPSGCTANTVNDVAAVAAAALSGSPSIKTYVVTIAIDPSTMAPVATAGGTTVFGTPTTGTVAAAANAVTSALVNIVNHACR